MVITDAAKDWKAIGKLTPEYFKGHYGTFRKKLRNRTYSLSEVVDLMRESDWDAPSPYPFKFNVEREFPELRPLFLPRLHYGRWNRAIHPLLPEYCMQRIHLVELFFGGKGCHFPVLHCDALHLHSQITSIYGSKEFYIYPPDQGRFLYPRPDNEKLSQIDNPLRPDLDRFPLFREAKPLRVVVNQGETLFFATGWWHFAVIHEPSITYGMGQLNSLNYDLFVEESTRFMASHRPWLSRVSRAYLKLIGRGFDLAEALI